MSNKGLFFDIDGTLVSFETHRIPESTKTALRKVKSDGAKIIIATGRPLSLVDNLSEISDLIDGYITANGAFSVAGDKTVSIDEISRKEAVEIFDFADKLSLPIVLSGTKNNYLHNPNDLLRNTYGTFIKLDVDHFVEVDTLPDEPFIQMTVFMDEEQQQLIMPSLPGCTAERWHPTFTDVLSVKANKGEGLRKMAEYFDIPLTETYAFGDGGNDVPMMKAAGVGVAMGNAFQVAKDAADWIAPHIDDNGIEAAFKHLGLI